MRSAARTSCLLTATIVFLFIPLIAFALPEGESVVSGSATFDRSASNTLNVNTPSERLIVNYNSFSIAQPETVSFQQPSASSIVLNRVVGVDPSAIMGTLNANGRVFIVNPNGVIFGPNSRVDVAGLVASSLNISNDDFLNGKHVFTKSGKNGYVINEGTINARGGYVCLLGGAVDNRMMIQAELGTVVLAAGEKITVSLEDQNAISVVVDEAVQSEVFGPGGVKMTSAVKNSGSILAEGGKVMLTAKVLNRVFDHAINNTGLVKVTSLVEREGVIELVAEGAPIVNSGTLEADRIYIKGSNADFVNTPEARIIANAVAAASPDGGKIAIEATSVLQQGLICANALEQGAAGEIIIVSEGTATFDSSSCTEARAMGIVGNGGRINITSKQTSVFVNKNAKIDFSAGAVSGNGGLLRIDAFEQLGFYGILNGRAPPGYTPGKAILDPLLSVISGEFSSNTIIYSPNDISIVGDIYVTSGEYYDIYFSILADHNSETVGDWHDGIGAIINTGDYVIYFSENTEYSSLVLRAGSGIGSLAGFIQTYNAGHVSAVTNPVPGEDGDIFLEELGSRGLAVSDVRSPGLVVINCSGPVWGDSEGADVTADELYITAEGGIGSYYNPFEVNVRNFAAENVDYGDIYIYSPNDLTVLAISNRVSGGEAGEVSIDCGGNLSIRYGIYASFDVWLSAEGNIILSTFADIVAPGSYVTLDALGYITRRNMEVENFGMRAYWNFDQEPYYYYYYAQDVSGNGYSAYASGNPGIVPGPDGFGQALYFNGVNDYINIGRDFYFGTGAFTLICWYQGEQSRNNVGLMGVSPYPYTSGYAMETQYGALQSWVNNDMDASSPVTVNDNQWYRLAMVREGSEGSMYLFQENDLNPDTDELQYGSTFGTSPDSVDTYGSFFIGGWGHMYRLAQGALDDVRVYGTALSGLEIYAQTILAPGTGRISAYNVELYANSGVDMGLGTVETMHVSNNTGAIVIDSLSDLDINAGTFDDHDGGVITDGDITLITAGNIYVNEDIYTIGDRDLTLTADGSIVLAEQVSVYSNSDLGEGDAPNGYSGNVTLDAGLDVIFGRGASVYSYAGAFVYEGTGYAISGNVSIYAGLGDIDMEWGRVNSQANASGYGNCSANSGNVILSAGNNLIETGFLELIYSQASASVYENPDSTALARSGTVSLSAGNSLSIDGRDAEYYYGADIFSYAYALGGMTATAYSSSVSLSSGGDISIYRTDVRSDASAQTFVEGNAGTWSDAIAGTYAYDDNNYEWRYMAVLVDAGRNINTYDNTLIYGHAVASGSAFNSYAQAGDVTLDAWYAISPAGHIYSDAIAYAGDVARAVTGKVNLISYNGPITIPNTTLVWSNASANTIYEDSEAFAYSDDVTVQCLNGPVSVAIGVYSTAEAYGGDDISPRRLEAETGDVLVYAGGDLSLPGGYAYTSATTSSDNAGILYLTSGDVSLFGANISLTDGRVYSGQNDNDADWVAVNEIDITAGDVLLSSPGNISVSGYAQITSSARAYCISMEASEDTVSAAAGDIELSAGGNITLDLALVELIPIESFGSYSFYESEMYYASGTVSLLADADWSGSGTLSHTGDSADLGGANFNFSGAQSFDFYAGDGIDVSTDGLLPSLDLNIPGWGYPGISLASTLDTGSVAEDIDYYEGYSVVPYIRLYSAGDVVVNSDLSAVEIVLRADYDPFDPQGIGNGAGSLIINGIPYGDVAVFYRDPYILADSHAIQTAGAIEVIGDRIICGENELDLALGPSSGELLGALTVKSTSGSVTVTETEEPGGEYLSRTGDAGIDIWASGDIVLDVPVMMDLGGLSLISDTGSIIAGAGEMTHITAGSDVYLQAGNEYISEGTSTIGALDAPLRIMVDGGSVTLRVYGQIMDEELNEAVSGNLEGAVNGSVEPDAIQLLNDAPGPVYFNNAPSPEPAIEPDETDDDDQGDGTQPGPVVPSAPAPEAPAAPLGNIISYEPSTVDPAALETMQFSSPIGTVFAYHPVTQADTGSVEPLPLGAGSYELIDGELRLIGNEGLLQFFQEFDKKYRQL
ncbi:MAG TPA: filamentous hemagglutinin N-terminal domain-containing protein [Candidatus Omnitrophota bacterium]|nr:filamentous hemagglutinin N-terminal domain-containing protein [Candidatus Omnitrophota bacterium]